MGTKLSPSKGGRRGRREERPEEKGTHLGTKLTLSQGARCRRRGVREGLEEDSFPSSKNGHELAGSQEICLSTCKHLSASKPLSCTRDVRDSEQFTKLHSVNLLATDVSLSAIKLLGVFENSIVRIAVTYN